MAPTHLNQIKRLAAFQNPEFYKKQSLRLSTALTPRVIACAVELPEHVALPRGCVTELEQLLREHDSALRLEDQRCDGKPLDVTFQGQLTPVQKKAGRALLRDDIGVLVAPPGVGKTVIGTYLIAARSRSTLVLVHRQPLLDQWIAQLSMFLGLAPKAIGQIGAGKHTANGRLDVAMIQSLVRLDRVNDLVATYGHVIVDECHHVPAVSFERVLSEVKARFVTGLTATPRRRDGLHPIAEMQLGPVRFAVDARSDAARRPFDHRLIVRETAFGRGRTVSLDRIQPLYAALATDEGRNRLILADVASALAEGRSPILLTERKDHLEYFAHRLRGDARHLVVLRSSPPAATLAKDSTTCGSIPCFWRCPSPGRALWCRTPAGFIACTPVRPKSGFTTMWIARFPCSTGCSRSACADTARSATRETRCRLGTRKRIPSPWSQGSVVRVQLTLRDEIVAVCRRAGTRQTVPLLDLPLPSPPPVGSQWILAYRHWLRGG